jgi:hypothetical protein
MSMLMPPPMPSVLEPKMPVANLFGQHGPRCPACSGLGRVLRPRVGYSEGPSSAGFCRSTSGCICKGTGIDQEIVREQERQAMYARIATLESKCDRLSRLESKYDRLLKQISRTKRPDGKMSRQYWMEAIAWATADGTAVHTTTTEAILFPNVTIPANYMQDGRALRIRAFGKLSTTATPTMTWALRWGGVSGTLLATTEAITQGSGVANVNWALEAMIQTRTNGATGTLLVMGEMQVHTSATAVLANVFGVSGFDAPAAVTCDLTTDQALSLTGDWSASSASNTITGMIYTLESLN